VPNWGPAARVGERTTDRDVSALPSSGAGRLSDSPSADDLNELRCINAWAA